MSFGGVRLFANQKTCDVSAAQKDCENLDLVCIGIGLDGCELENEKLTRCLKNMRRLRARLRKFGRRLLQRQGAKADAPKVAALYKKACDSGYPLGCANLGHFTSGGLASKTRKRRAKTGARPARRKRASPALTSAITRY